MKRIAMAAATALLVTVGVVGCGGTGDSSGSGSASKPAASKPAKLDPADITLWVGFTQRELKVFKDTVKEFEALNPGVKVRVVGGINDDKIIAASRGGKAPDVAQSFSADNSGAFCGSGAWVDLKPYIKRDGINDTIFPPAPRSYTQFEGTRCALPMLADAYGPLLQRGHAQEGGARRPAEDGLRAHRVREEADPEEPRRLAEGRRLQPGHELVLEHAGELRPDVRRQVGGRAGKSSIGSDPAWAKLLTWQKELIDWYGYDKLVSSRPASATSSPPPNAFEKGKVAMNVDGEWRTAFIADEARTSSTARRRCRSTTTTPASTAAATRPATSPASRSAPSTREQAWALLKYLATDDKAMALLSNGLRNVPTTTSSAKSPDLKPDPKFATFLKIFGNPNTTTTPVTAAGSANQELFNGFANKWQAGPCPTSQAGLDGRRQADRRAARASRGQSSVP